MKFSNWVSQSSRFRNFKYSNKTVVKIRHNQVADQAGLSLQSTSTSQIDEFPAINYESDHIWSLTIDQSHDDSGLHEAAII